MALKLSGIQNKIIQRFDIYIIHSILYKIKNPLFVKDLMKKVFPLFDCLSWEFK